MNFRQLGYFIAVAEELHFGRAAERLDMAQPPLSRQIKQLEEDLGVILFNRGRSAITLTQAGERLLVRGKSILAQLDDMQLEVRRLGQGAEGRLRIGFVGSAAFGILPNIIKSYRANYPEVNLSLVPMNNAQLHRALVSRALDVAFARPALKDPEFLTKEMMEEKLIGAGRHERAEQRTTSVSRSGPKNSVPQCRVSTVANRCSAAAVPRPVSSIVPPYSPRPAACAMAITSAARFSPPDCATFTANTSAAREAAISSASSGPFSASSAITAIS